MQRGSPVQDVKELRGWGSSKELLESLAELREIERRRREPRLAAPRYHELGAAAEAKSRQIFRWVADEAVAVHDLPARWRKDGAANRTFSARRSRG